VWSNGGKAPAASKPVTIAVSHGHSRSNCLLTSTATASPLPFFVALSVRIEGILQIVRIRWVDAKRGALHILQSTNIHFGGDEVSHGEQALERVEKFSRLHFVDAVEEKFPGHGGAAEANRFQNHDLTTV